MSTLLHIDGSARQARSISRELSKAFIEQWTERRPSDRIIRRDVGASPPPAIDEDWIAAAFTDPAERTDEQRSALAISDRLVDEVLASDVIVIGTGMYNYGLPAALKAWIDQVIRIGRTFTFDLARGEQPIEPILSGKILVTLTSTGEGLFGVGEPQAAKNHVEPQLDDCSRLLGVSHRIGTRVEWQEFDDERHEASRHAAVDALPRLMLEAEALLSEVDGV